MLVLTVLATLLASSSPAGGEDDKRLRVRLVEPSWSVDTISVNARLLILAQIVPAVSLDEVWLEFRRESGDDWQRRPIPASRWMLATTRTVVATILEPRSLPGVKAGDTLEVRISAAGKGTAPGTSDRLIVRIEDADRREALLLSRLDSSLQDLQILRAEFERDHRKLCRIERKFRDAEVLDSVASAEVESIESQWNSRLDQLRRLSNELLDVLDVGATDQLVDPRREDRFRKTFVAVRRDCDSAQSPSSLMREHLARARRTKTPEERRSALQATLDASDRFIDLLQIPLGALEAWHGSLEIRRTLRSLIQVQKDVTENLDRQLHR